MEVQAPESALLSLTTPELARWLHEAVSLLAVIDDFERSVSEHREAVRRAASGLSPMIVTPNADLRFLIIEALQGLGGEPYRLVAASEHLLQPTAFNLEPSQAATLLRLLVEVGGMGLEEVAGKARVIFEDWLCDEQYGEDLQVATVELAGIAGGATAIFAMIAQIMATTPLHWAAAFAALRQVASRRPSQLRLAIDLLARPLHVSDVSVDDLAYLVDDLIERSSVVVVLDMLVRTDPGSQPDLFAAAFDSVEEQPPRFRIRDRLAPAASRFGDIQWMNSPRGHVTSDDMGLTEIDVPSNLVFERDGVRLRFDDFLPTVDQILWVRSLGYATGVMPIITPENYAGLIEVYRAEPLWRSSDDEPSDRWPEDAGRDEDGVDAPTPTEVNRPSFSPTEAFARAMESA